ncbi:hypothetical protein OEZ86_011745 [Tetradesmus obliquus]|nr:hypothetical protein OEZ86_011745 [Tetradesmus obliquus]
MEPVILALAEALWPALEQQEAERSAGNAAALNQYLRLSGADMKQVPEEVLKMVENCFVGAQQQQLKLALQLLGYRLPTLLMAGHHSLSPQWPLLQPFHKMPLQARQAVLRSWAHSSLPQLRKAYKGLKGLLAAAILTHIDPATGTNPCFQALGYSQGDRLQEQGLGPLPAAAEAAEEVLCSATVHVPELVAAGLDVQACLAKRGFLLTRDGGHSAAAVTAAAAADANSLPDQQQTSSTAAIANGKGSSSSGGSVELFYDTVIVGSGAGGGVTAALLAAAGMRVLVLEKAGWMRRKDMSWLEGESHAEMYERAGFLATEDGGINVLAGSTLGGGTKINWTASLRTPEHVRREWAAAPHNLEALGPDSKAFSASLDAVCSRLGVSTGTEMSGPNARLLQGLEALGAHGEELPRNCLSKKCSAYCNFGCRSGHKQSSDVTWLVDAVRMGAHVLTGMEAQRVLLEANDSTDASSDAAAHRRRQKAAGVLALSSPRTTPGAPTPTLQQVPITIHAPLVVASCGSIHTPALLLRSGVRCSGNVGRHLRLHPAAGLVGFFERSKEQQAAGQGAVEMYQGVSMGSYSRAAAGWSEGGYGAMVSVPAAHPGLLGAICPDSSPGALKKMMLDLRDGSGCVIFTRDSGSGSVGVDGAGRPVIRYWLDKTTEKHLFDGIELAVRALAAAGACRILLPNNCLNWDVRFDPEAAPEARAATLEAFIAQLRRRGVYPKYGLQLLSAHQMGSCRMGSSPRSSAVDASGQCWQVAGLYVADASLFPTPSGVNPMITVYGLAHMVASGIAQRWKAAKKAKEAAAKQ